MRIGAVNYLNSRPLVDGLGELAPEVRLLFDLPSRLADSLQAGRLDVALVPSVEYFRAAGYRIVSDACVACRGPVLSVKLHFRVPPQAVGRVALDEGSRTSAALVKILLAELHGVRPDCELLPIGCGPDSTDADAVLLIGDRAITSCVSPAVHGGKSIGQVVACGPRSAGATEMGFVESWDLGEEWTRWTGLPFVFAMWIARPDFDASEAERILTSARDHGVQRLTEIAAREAASLSIDRALAVRYLCERLHYTLGRAELNGLERFRQLCEKHGLVPSVMKHSRADDWAARAELDRAVDAK